MDSDSNKTDLIKNIIDYFRKDYRAEIVKTKYEFGIDRDRMVPLFHINAGRYQQMYFGEVVLSGK